MADEPRLALVPIEGGFRALETETHYVEIMRMLFNWRLVTTPKSCPLTHDSGWCYPGGTGARALHRVIQAAMEWGGDLSTEPKGWMKNVMTGEYREPTKDSANGVS